MADAERSALGVHVRRVVRPTVGDAHTHQDLRPDFHGNTRRAAHADGHARATTTRANDTTGASNTHSVADADSGTADQYAYYGSPSTDAYSKATTTHGHAAAIV